MLSNERFDYLLNDAPFTEFTEAMNEELKESKTAKLLIDQFFRFLCQTTKQSPTDLTLKKIELLSTALKQSTYSSPDEEPEKSAELFLKLQNILQEELATLSTKDLKELFAFLLTIEQESASLSEEEIDELRHLSSTILARSSVFQALIEEMDDEFHFLELWEQISTEYPDFTFESYPDISFDRSFLYYLTARITIQDWDRFILLSESFGKKRVDCPDEGTIDLAIEKLKMQLFEELKKRYEDLPDTAREGPRFQTSQKQKRFIRLKQKAIEKTLCKFQEGKNLSDCLKWLRVFRSHIAFVNLDPHYADYGEKRRYSSDQIFVSSLRRCTDNFETIKPRLQKLNRSHISVIQGKIPSCESAIPLSSFDFENDELIHTDPKYFPLIQSYLNELFILIRQEQNPDLAFEKIARFQWWFCHMCPYKAGSAAISEIFTTTFLEAKGIRAILRPGIGPIDLFALTEENVEEFVKALRSFYLFA